MTDFDEQEERENDHPRNCECHRCQPDPEPAGLRDRDEWKHEAAEWQRLK